MLKLFSLFTVYFVLPNLFYMSIRAFISLCLSFNLPSKSIFFSYTFTSKAFSYFSKAIIFFFNFILSSSIFITYVFYSSCFFKSSYIPSSFSYSLSFTRIDSFSFDNLAFLFVYLRFPTIIISLVLCKFTSFSFSFLFSPFKFLKIYSSFYNSFFVLFSSFIFSWKAWAFS